MSLAVRGKIPEAGAIGALAGHVDLHPLNKLSESPFLSACCRVATHLGPGSTTGPTPPTCTAGRSGFMMDLR